jgi:hypothetical protein
MFCRDEGGEYFVAQEIVLAARDGCFSLASKPLFQRARDRVPGRRRNPRTQNLRLTSACVGAA